MKFKGSVMLVGILIIILGLGLIVNAKTFKSELEEIQYAQNLYKKAEQSFTSAESQYTDGNIVMNKDGATVKEINTATKSFLTAANRFGEAEQYYNEANVILAKYVTEEPAPIPEPIVYNNPEPVYVDPEPYIEPEEIKTFLGTIQFDLDKAIIKVLYKGKLDNMITKIIESDGAIYVDGHTCDIATDEYNMALSRQRANRVVNYLVAHGVKRSNIVPNWYGEENPTVSNATEEGKSKNRRVEIYLIVYK
ncbi:OmpA family protein [Candidatus Dependentiae bacterium]|nr:OmpA family protein [Candidatus Dependentiae bacterium]